MRRQGGSYKRAGSGIGSRGARNPISGGKLFVAKPRGTTRPPTKKRYPTGGKALRPPTKKTFPTVKPLTESPLKRPVSKTGGLMPQMPQPAFITKRPTKEMTAIYSRYHPSEHWFRADIVWDWYHNVFLTKKRFSHRYPASFKGRGARNIVGGGATMIRGIVKKRGR